MGQIETLNTDEKNGPLKMKIKRSVDGEWISYFTSAKVPSPTCRAAVTGQIETLNTDEKNSPLKMKIEISV